MIKRASCRAAAVTRLLLGVLLLGGLVPATAGAEELNPPTLEAVNVGYGGHFKIAHWTPVELVFQGGSKSLTGQVRIMLPDGDGIPTIITHQRPVQLAPGRTTKVLLYAKFGRMYGELRVLFSVDDKNVIDRTISTNVAASDRLTLPMPTTADQKLIVTLGGSTGVEEAARAHEQATGYKIEIGSLRDVNELPTEWYGYDGIDWLVISTSQPEMFTKLLDTGARRAALAQWIELGGKLLFVVGSQAPAILAADAPLAGFAPGRFVEPAALRRTTDLEGYVGGARKVPRGNTDRELALPVPRLENVQGKIEVADGNLPLIVRSARRFGQIVFVGVDLDRKPFTDWEGRGALVGRLLGLAEVAAKDPSQNAAQTPFRANYGGWELLSQLRTVLDNFAGVTPIPFAVVAILILGYIALIGPGDYFLVKRVLKRMELTWITFPIWVVLISAGAYALAVYTKGDDLRLNQVDLVDVDVTSGLARGTSWLNVFSPQSQSFDMSLTPKTPQGDLVEQCDRLFAWLGSPENELGGGGGAMFSGRYSFAPRLDAMLQVPIQVWSTKSFLSRTAYQIDEVVTADLTLGPEGVPEGTLRNESDLTFTDCTLLCGRWAYVLDRVTPGAVVRLKPGEHRDLSQVLRRQGQTAPNNPYGQPFVNTGDAFDILQAMMFYDAFVGSFGGSTQNVGGTNGSQQFVDLSGLLNLDRAMLVGKTDRAAAQLTNGGAPLAGPQDRHWTIYRFVFPVSRGTSARE